MSSSSSPPSSLSSSRPPGKLYYIRSPPPSFDALRMRVCGLNDVFTFDGTVISHTHTHSHTFILLYVFVCALKKSSVSLSLSPPRPSPRAVRSEYCVIIIHTRYYWTLVCVRVYSNIILYYIVKSCSLGVNARRRSSNVIPVV